MPAEMGGESPSNADRTSGRRVLYGVNFQIQEHQDVLAASEVEEIKAAIAIAKAYWPTTSKTLSVPFGDGSVTYTPDTTFETDTVRVVYAYSGTDTSSLVVEGEQRVGADSLQTVVHGTRPDGRRPPVRT